MTADRRLAIVLMIATFALGTVIGWVGLGPTPLDDILKRMFEAPAIGLGLGPYAIFYFTVFMTAVSDRRTVVAVIVGGLGAGLAHLVLNPLPELGEALMQGRILTVAMWLGAACLAALGWRAWRGGDAETRNVALGALAACLFITIGGSCPPTFLHGTVMMFPATFDGTLYRFDATLGFQPSGVAAQAALALPPTMTVLDLVYFNTGFWYAAVFGLTLRWGAKLPVDLLYVWALASLGFLAYLFFPASGPLYMFREEFPNALPPADVVPAGLGLVFPAPRNAMPSMHTAWVILLWAYARLLGSRWVETVCAVVLALTVAATLAKGEHYLSDLAVAVPFSAAILAASLRTVPWADARKRKLVFGGLAVWVAWIVALRVGLGVFEAVPGLSWLALIATTYYGVVLIREFLDLARVAAPTGIGAPESAGAAQPGLATVTLLFFASGFTALIYEVVFSKSLGLVFGSMATATYTVLATYMGGMALGAWIGGRIAARRLDPLVIYAVCEGLIGLYCAATPWLFKGITAVYVPLAAGLPPDAPALIVLRVLLGGGALLVPTVLMGMTLPALARFCSSGGASMGRSVAVLYGANTLGAAFGALLAGYLVLPALGLTRSIAVTAVGSLIVALVALKLRERVAAAGGEAAAAHVPAEPVAATGSIARRSHLALAFGALFVTGLITLALEVLYMHLLAVVAGNSVYAFSLMLFTFLLGLGGGAELARALLRLRQPLLLTIGWLQLGLAAVVLFGVLQWDAIPVYFASYGDYPIALSFGAREAIRAMVCFAVMFPPALVIGALYPLAIELATRSSSASPVAMVGRAAAVNTLGNIAGVLLAGFVLLPLLGSVVSIQLLAAGAVALGLVCAWAGREGVSLWRPLAPAAVVLAAVAVQPAGLDYTMLSTGANVYFRLQPWGEVIDRAESADGGLTTVVSKELEGRELKTLLTNGKFQGNNATGGEMKAQAGFALAPLLHTGRRDRALVIGYGTGGSADTVHSAGFRELDVVELSADILALADRHFPEVNRGVTRRPGVRTFVTDGRNFLLLQPETYDLISMEISSIWFAGAANLYNREFYRLVNARLAPGGVFQQWIQLHHIRPEDVLYVLGSVRSEFRHVWVYFIGGQGIIVATNDPASGPSAEHVRRLVEAPGLKETLALYDDNLDEIRSSIIIDPRGIDLFLGSLGGPAARDAWVATDDNLVLEYGTPKGNVLDGATSMQQNVATLQRFQAQAVARAP